MAGYYGLLELCGVWLSAANAYPDFDYNLFAVGAEPVVFAVGAEPVMFIVPARD